MKTTAEALFDIEAFEEGRRVAARWQSPTQFDETLIGADPDLIVVGNFAVYEGMPLLDATAGPMFLEEDEAELVLHVLELGEDANLSSIPAEHLALAIRLINRGIILACVDARERIYRQDIVPIPRLDAELPYVIDPNESDSVCISLVGRELFTIPTIGVDIWESIDGIRTIDEIVSICISVIPDRIYSSNSEIKYFG